MSDTCDINYNPCLSFFCRRLATKIYSEAAVSTIKISIYCACIGLVSIPNKSSSFTISSILSIIYLLFLHGSSSLLTVKWM